MPRVTSLGRCYAARAAAVPPDARLIHEPSTVVGKSGIRSDASRATSWISPLSRLGPGGYISSCPKGQVRTARPDRGVILGTVPGTGFDSRKAGGRGTRRRPRTPDLFGAGGPVERPVLPPVPSGAFVCAARGVAAPSRHLGPLRRPRRWIGPVRPPGRASGGTSDQRGLVRGLPVAVSAVGCKANVRAGRSLGRRAAAERGDRHPRPRHERRSGSRRSSPKTTTAPECSTASWAAHGTGRTGRSPHAAQGFPGRATR